MNVTAQVFIYPGEPFEVYQSGPTVGLSASEVSIYFMGDSLDESIDLAQDVLRKALDAITERWPQ
jgi:hypothetical protein